MRNTLTAFVPAHKQTNPEHKPGQVVNPLGFTIEQTLGQYINRVKRGDAFDQVAAEKKLTFEQWADTATDFDIEAIDFVYHGVVWDMLEKCWKAAQENCR